MYVEAWDGTAWNMVDSLQLFASGWNNYGFSLAGHDVAGIVTVRFRGESSGLGADFYNDLLLDDVCIGCLPIAAPICEDFALGALPTSGCGWSIYATSGSGWVFTGNPGYNASTTMGNNNTAGEFAWIDFSSTDVSPTLEMTSVNVSGLFSPTLSFDYFSDLGTYVCAPSNIMYVETWNGSSWDTLTSLQIDTPGWNNYQYPLASTSTVTVRFRGESSGQSCDFYNDLLLDNVCINNGGILGCTDSTAVNYNPAATVDDGSCSWCSTNDLTITVGGGAWQSEVSWHLVNDATGDTAASGGAPYNGDACVPSGCYTMHMYDSYGDGWNGNTYDVSLGGVSIASGGLLSGFYGTSAVAVGVPAAQCNCTTSWVTLSMNDSYGDGWNGNTWTATSNTGGSTYGPFTIASGFSGSESFCMDDDCYDLVCDFGAWQSEVSWTLTDANGTVLASGGAPYTGQISTGSANCCVYGCTDSTATNYDPLATCDDGSCTYCVYGCMDTSQFNYNPLATCDDGTCIPIIYGCTDSTAINYYAPANTNNGTCVYPIYGCTNPLACNYDSTANVDDGSCLTAYGCTDPLACNYDSAATCDDGSCNTVYGCMDATAFNYNPLATCDDNSCIASVYGCTDGSATAMNYNPLANVNQVSATDSSNPCTYCSPTQFVYGTRGFGSEQAWTLTNGAGTVLLSVSGQGSFVTTFDSLCLVDGCYVIHMTDSYGDGWSQGSSVDVSINGVSIVSATIASSPTGGNYADSVVFSVGGVSCVYGCTDSTAANYNSAATIDDGSCTGVAGCMDPLATNYNPLAVVACNGCCTYPTSVSYTHLRAHET